MLPNKYIGTNCGYSYNPSEGYPDDGLPPGTPFEELSDDSEYSIYHVFKTLLNPF